MIRKSKSLLKNGSKAQGVIVGKKWVQGNRHSIVFPLIQFSTIDGCIVEAEGNVGTSVSTFETGERVTVFYDTRNPKNFVLDSDSEQSAPFLIIFVALVMVAAVLGWYFDII